MFLSLTGEEKGRGRGWMGDQVSLQMWGGERVGSWRFHSSPVRVYGGSLGAGHPLCYIRVRAHSRAPKNFHTWIKGKEADNVNARLLPRTEGGRKEGHYMQIQGSPEALLGLVAP